MRKSDGLAEFRIFANSLKNKNRFIVDENFNRYIDIIIEQLSTDTIAIGTPLYRSRINPNGVTKPYKGKQIGMPPKSVLNYGRANPYGIQYMYLTEEYETSIAECRPNTDNHISVGRFEVTDVLRLVHLEDVAFISSGANASYDTMIIAEFLLGLSYEFAKPFLECKEIEYLPCQYFAEYCKSKKMDGIKFVSCAKGFPSRLERNPSYNIVLFDDKKVKWIDTRVYQINKIVYDIEPIEDVKK